MRLPVLCVASLVFSLTCPACGSDSDRTTGAGPSAVTQTVGPDGGAIVVGGATVTIPKGALADAKVITISVSEAGPPEGFVALSKVFRCEPSGTDFAQPVVMEMPFTDDGLAKTMFWSSGSDPTFKDVGGTASNGTMKATVLHFSSGFVGRRK